MALCSLRVARNVVKVIAIAQAAVAIYLFKFWERRQTGIVAHFYYGFYPTFGYLRILMIGCVLNAGVLFCIKPPKSMLFNKWFQKINFLLLALIFYTFPYYPIIPMPCSSNEELKIYENMQRNIGTDQQFCTDACPCALR